MTAIYIIAFSLGVLLLLEWLPDHKRPHLVHPSQVSAVVLLCLLGTFSPHYLVFAVGVVLVIVLAPAFSPQGLVLPPRDALELRGRMLVFTLPLMPMLTYTFAIGGVTVVPITYVMLVVAGAWLALARSGERVGREFRVMDALLLVMLLVQIFMDGRGNEVGDILRGTLLVGLQSGLLYFVVSRAFKDSRSPSDLLIDLLVAGAILAVLAQLESFRFWLLYDAMPHALGANLEDSSGYAKQRGGMLRGRATYNESTGLSLFLGVLIVMLLALRRRFAQSWPRFFAIGLMLVAGMLATFARVGYVAIAAGLIALPLFERNWAALLRLAILLPSAWLALTILSALSPVIAASTGFSGEADGSVEYRRMMLDACLGIIRESPVFGMSIPDIMARLEHLRNGEGIIDLLNQPLIIFMRAGIVGGTLYFSLMAGVLGLLWIGARSFDPDARAAAGACFCGVISLLVGLVTTSYGRNESVFIFLLAAGAGILCRFENPISRAAIGQPSLIRPARVASPPRK